jgi:hypothetical protein
MNEDLSHALPLRPFASEPGTAEPDVDVPRSEESDELAPAAIPATRSGQQSPWDIGASFYDQRDFYTRDARIDEAGYAAGPNVHPEEGSYAYRREPPVVAPRPPPEEARFYQREAWPWLNYPGSEEDPYFAHLRKAEPAAPPRGLRGRVIAIGRAAYELLTNRAARQESWRTTDRRIRKDIGRAFDIRDDLDSSDIEITVTRGRVTLEGTVPDLRSKRLAEATALGIREVIEVENRLTIRRDDPTDRNVLFALPYVAR